jgi:hypothetical protein
VTASKRSYYRYDSGAKTWTVVPTPELGRRPLQALWGTDPSNVWLPGGKPAHFDGEHWDTSLTMPAGLREVHGTARDDIWQVGWLGGHKDDVGAAFHFDGKAWTQADLPRDTPLLWSVSAASRTEAYAVGGSGWTLVWDGTAWRGSAAGVEGTLRTVYSPGGGVAFAGGVIGPYVLRRNQTDR